MAENRLWEFIHHLHIDERMLHLIKTSHLSSTDSMHDFRMQSSVLSLKYIIILSLHLVFQVAVLEKVS
jgi:hypothetical protein